nr:radical SAM protein [Vagococcus fluvialis]
MLYTREYLSSPLLVDYDLTNYCNAKCTYCSANATPQEDIKKELTLLEITELFNELDRMNVLKVSIGGGEPFARKDIFDVLSIFEQYNFVKVLNTNAMLITDKKAKQLKTYNLDRVCVTIDGSNEKIHDLTRGRGSFKQTIHGVANLLKYNIPLTVLFTLNNTNTKDFINTIKFVESLGIDSLTAMVMCPTGRAANGSFSLNKDTWYPVFLKISEMLANEEIKLRLRIIPPNESDVLWSHYFPLEHYSRLDLLEQWEFNFSNYSKKENREISCQAGIKACSISSQGDVYGCNLMTALSALNAGNIRTESFEEIWHNSSVFKSFRSMNFEDLDGPCSRCPHEWCGGGCRSAAMNLTGSLTGSDISCFYAETMEAESR